MIREVMLRFQDWPAIGDTHQHVYVQRVIDPSGLKPVSDE